MEKPMRARQCRLLTGLVNGKRLRGARFAASPSLTPLKRAAALRTLSAALVIVGLAGPARADGWYLGLGFAPAWLNTTIRYSDGSQVDPEPATSFMMDGTLGYRWEPGWRVEAEPYWTVADATRAGLTGDVRVRGILANVLYDTPIRDNFSFTVGGGLGWANVSPSLSRTNGLSVADQGQSAFAWQLLAGVSYEVNSNFELQVDYRYRGISDTKHDSSYLAINPAVATHTDLQAIMFSVRWYPWGSR
jgi:opacity protein-like surface antigen